MSADAIYGTLNLLVLSSLSAGASHGLGVKRRIEALGDGRLTVEAGALYPALRRLEGKGFVEAEWGLSEKGRRARIYRLTRAGADHLAAERARWADHVDAISSVLAEGSSP